MKRILIALLVASAGLLWMASTGWARPDVTFTDDFGTNSAWLRWGPEWGSRGWYCPFDLTYSLVAEPTPVPGMSGAVAKLQYDSMYEGQALRPLPEGATNLAAFKLVELEITLCMTNAPYGGGLFLVRNAYFVDADWYGSPIKYLNYSSASTDWFGVVYSWASYEAGVAVGQPTLVAYTNTVATGTRATCLDINKTYRCRVSFDFLRNRMKLEQKVFDSVGSIWGDWTTAVDWVSAGCDLRAMGLNAMMIRSFNVTPHATYNTYMDDFSFRAVTLPSGTIFSVY